ncbi:MAG: hypothetical protein ABR616_05775 [Dermatophilaceae bacterium]|nr:GPW/gp25 family protein [Intrasporangiaceae bacterium]
MNSVPHFELPLRLRGSGSFAVLEQDFPEEIVQAVEVLLRTEVGTRVEVPEYGAESMLFRTVINRDLIAQQIEEWEPRVIAILEDRPDDFDVLVRRTAARIAERENT